jgi:hypothetical protein
MKNMRTVSTEGNKIKINGTFWNIRTEIMHHVLKIQ